MWKILVAAVALLSAANAGFAASAINKDSEPRTLVVTQGSSKTDLQINPGETVQFCPKGCFVTLPNGDLEALNGSETIEISGGMARIK
jgi:hypothetical protein